ncbi:hypothetical protein M9H77_02614 [Catharanthus roseus]|uniref:Uncharacterized protein n=1 Tax=Catharanthus roseus TaxID=4058 RepID=A0ACC0C969_CATRO|nr:hypothetical protein M9H77_02614 [Catharanthus roseus]
MRVSLFKAVGRRIKALIPVIASMQESSKQTICNVRAKMKKKMMEGHNMGQITEIKTTLEYSRLKESNPVIAQLYYNVSHLVVKIIKDEKKRAAKILVDLENLCGHWVRTSHMLPYSCELFKRYQMYIPLKLEDVHVFLRSLEINGLSGIGGQQSAQESDLQK